MARPTSQNSGADSRPTPKPPTSYNAPGPGQPGYVNTKATNADTAYWSSMFPGMSSQQITDHLQSLPRDQQQKYLQGAAENKNKVFNPESGLDRWMGGIALVGSLATAGMAGYALAPALVGAAGGVGSVGGAAAGAGVGATTGATTAGLSGGNVGKGALLGALGGGFGASGLGQSLSNATGLSPTASNAVVKGAVGAGGAALTGGNPLTSGVGGVAGGFGVPGAGALANIAGKYAAGSTSNGSSGGYNYLGAGALGAGALMSSGGQGNNGNMASTDSTLAGTITGALPGVIQGAAGVYGSQNAAEKMTQADQNAIGTQTSTLGNINNIWSTQQGLGQGADKSLGAALGTNGQPADYSGFENMPGYKFAVQQGTQAIQRQASSLGNAYTPNTAASVGQYVTGTAMQDYNTYINQLMGAAGLGSTANTGIANPTYQTGANISQLEQNQGYAQASGVSGAANAVGGMFGPNGTGTSLIGAAGRYLGGGTGGGGGGSTGGGGGGSSGGNLFQGPQSNWNNTGAGNGTWGSGYDPNTGGSWVNPGSTDMSSSFDSGSWNNTPTMPDIEGGSTDFGGGLDFGSDTSGDLNFLGGGWG